MENAYWEHNLADNSYRFVLSGNVRLTVEEVRSTISAMMTMQRPNPLYYVLVKAATDYMSRASNQTATEQRARAEQAQRSQAYHSAEEILRKAAEAMQSDIFKRYSAAGGRSFGGFDFDPKHGFSGRPFNDPPPPPRPNQPRHWKEVLGLHVNQHVQKHEAKAAYRRKALEVQQKHNGDEPSMHEDMVALNVAKRQFELELGK